MCGDDGGGGVRREIRTTIRRDRELGSGVHQDRVKQAAVLGLGALSLPRGLWGIYIYIYIHTLQMSPANSCIVCLRFCTFYGEIITVHRNPSWRVSNQPAGFAPVHRDD